MSILFTQYDRLTRKSGLELNADITEILALSTNASLLYNVTYNGSSVRIKTLKEIKICGIWFCTNKEKEYKLNIQDQIIKMGNMMSSWKSRNLTLEGKSLICKTFGLSQLVYCLQISFYL